MGVSVNGIILQNGTTERARPTVHSAKTVSEVKAALAALQQQEATVSSQLDTLIAAKKDLQQDLGRLDLVRAKLSAQVSKARSIHTGLLSDSASKANRLSSSVKRLDLEQDHVKATLTMVEQVAELKACVLGVCGSMGATQDWEAAASYLNRASKIPRGVIDGEFAARVVPTAEVPDVPATTLETASESLCTLFLKEFEKAVKDKDGPRITRFFKLFPLINRSDIGLDVYGRYVCQGVAERARASLNAGTAGNQTKDGFFYAHALTRLFEHIAQIVDGHGALVERHYGPGKMARVIERLQAEADLQGGIIIDSWADERQIDRQLIELKSYPYSFLLQSFSAQPRQQIAGPRSGSPAPTPGSEDEGIDVKTVDAMLNEITTMLSKWSLYVRFVTEKCRPSETPADSFAAPAFLVNSSLSRKVSSALESPFKQFAAFFFRRSLEKAFQMDEPPSGLSLTPSRPLPSSPPFITSAVEDIMYILSKLLTSALSACSLPLLTDTISTLTRILSSDFIGIHQRKMRDEFYPRAAIPGQLPPEYLIVSFIVLVNNLDVSRDYISQIVNNAPSSSTMTLPSAATAAAPAGLSSLFPNNPSDQAAAQAALTTLSTSFREKCSELLSDGINVLFNNVMKPRLRPMLSEAFRDADATYQLTAEQNEDYLAALTDAYHDDPDAARGFSPEVRQRFALAWDALSRPVARLLTPPAWDMLLAIVLAYLAKLLEKRVWTYSGRVNAHGAMRLEHDVNEIVKYACKGQKYAFRETFERVRQICMVMNVDDDEWEELIDDAGGEAIDEIAGKLDADERDRARGMRREVD
ncbi:hypothetical protein DV738_g5285, partial [Chaetothyriales sp. CBS 135597]